MAHQMVQEGVLWSSVIIKLGSHWHNSHIVNGVIDVDSKHIRNKITDFKHG